MAHFFLDESLQPGECVPGALVSVTGSEAKHAVTVSRVRAGEQLLLGNGAGLIVTGTVTTVSTSSTVSGAELTLEVARATLTPAPSPRIRLVQALAKGDRDELAIQAATELGIDGVIPWSAARSVSRWDGAKIEKGRDRWRSIVREATKQSIRPWLPDVAALVGIRQLAILAGTSRMLLLEPSVSVRLTEVATLAASDDQGATPPDIVLVVGPEGGIAPAELAALEQAGAMAVRLGESVLRTSTAGPAALAILNQSLGRW